MPGSSPKSATINPQPYCDCVTIDRAWLACHASSGGPGPQNFTVPVAMRTPSAIIVNATTTIAAVNTPDRPLRPDSGTGWPVTTALASCVTSYSSPSGFSLGTTNRCVREAVTASTMTPGCPAGVRIRLLATSPDTSAHATTAPTSPPGLRTVNPEPSRTIVRPGTATFPPLSAVRR